MAKVIMVQGTTSNAGKSLITAALCRIFMQDGYKTAPFKSQNMALNSFITKEGLEMGRAQVMQAEAACIEPDVRMNPILLKPSGNKGCQVVLNGEVYKNAENYHNYKEEMTPHILKSFNSLAEEYEIIVIEGAGSPAEINLREQDIANMGMAKLVDAPVIIVGDIDRGGVFASLAGTMLLLDDEDKSRIKGTIINKFRGDIEILKPGIDMFYDITKLDVLGVVPYLNVDIDDEDSLSERLINYNPKSQIDIAVIRLPHISNFTDFNVFSLIDGVSVRYVKNTLEIGNPDMIIIPGTKNTIDDLKWLRQSGLEPKIIAHANEGKAIFGICGGYQMLGQIINDPENVEGGGSIKGIGLLNNSTIFYNEKTRTQVKGKINCLEGFYKDLSNIEVTGYEIHMGETEIYDCNPLSVAEIVTDNYRKKSDGCVNDNVAGSYMHGIFDNSEFVSTLVNILKKKKGIKEESIENFDIVKYKESQYDILADSVRNSVDMKKIYQIMGM
jgi:adenosylcobyric acid synthase